MKKTLILRGLIAVSLLMVSVTLQAQFRLSALKVGYLKPKGADSGLLLTTEFTVPVDETVELGLSTNMYYSSYNKTSKVGVEDELGGITESTVQQELEYSSISVPLYGMVNIIIPSTQYFGYQIHGGLGWEMLFNKENNFVEDKSERRFYQGLSYLVSAGFHYVIGSRSALTGEVLYHHSKVSRDKKNEAGLPTWSEVDLSGFGLRFGIRFQLM